MLQNKIWAFQTGFSVVVLSIGVSFVYNKFKRDFVTRKKTIKVLII